MPKRPTKEKDSNHWAECGLPSSIAEYVAKWPDKDTSDDAPLLERARRFRAYWERNDDGKVKKYWTALEKSAIPRGADSGSDSLVTAFLVWPDSPSRQPYTALYGDRRRGRITLTVEQERAYYALVAGDVQRVLKFLHPREKGFQHLLEDASATGGQALIECIALRNIDINLVAALRHLAQVLSLVDPAAKYPTKQPDSPKAALSSYIAVLASLNQKFSKDESNAIANLANINNPRHPVTAAAVRMAWKRNPNTKK